MVFDTDTVFLRKQDELGAIIYCRKPISANSRVVHKPLQFMRDARRELERRQLIAKRPRNLSHTRLDS